MKKYFYLNEQRARNGIALVHEAREEALLGYRDYFKKNHNLDVVEYRGENIPHFITYDATTGRVREATLQERYERGEYQLDENQYIDGGKIKEIPQPSKNYLIPIWDSDLKKWRESENISELKEAKRLKLKLIRDTLNNSNYEFKEKFFQADDESKSKIFKSASINDNSDVLFNWIAADNSIVELTVEELKKLNSSIIQRERELFSHFTLKLISISEAETIEDIKRIEW